MEFFEFADVQTTEPAIRNVLQVENLPQFCAEIDAVDRPEPLGHVIYFPHWGRFHIRREEIMGGVRFWIPDCPNALAWTVTTGYPPHPQRIVLHATINRTFHDEEFIEATRALLAALKQGLEDAPENTWPQRTESMAFLGDLRGGSRQDGG